MYIPWITDIHSIYYYLLEKYFLNLFIACANNISNTFYLLKRKFLHPVKNDINDFSFRYIEKNIISIFFISNYFEFWQIQFSTESHMMYAHVFNFCCILQRKCFRYIYNIHIVRTFYVSCYMCLCMLIVLLFNFETELDPWSKSNNKNLLPIIYSLWNEIHSSIHNGR